jgi:hypothetical protein
VSRDALLLQPGSGGVSHHRDEYSRYYKDDRKYFELENFYDEFSKPWQERRLPMEHRPDQEGVEVYRRWRELNS